MSQHRPPRRQMDHEPDLSTATVVEVLVSANRRGMWRAAVPMVVVALFFSVMWLPFRESDDLGFPVMAMPFLVAGALRVVLWHRTLAARSLVATDLDLVVTARNRVSRWVPWADVTGLEVYGGDLLPEWKRTAVWFTVTVLPQTRIQPESAFVGDFVELLVRRKDRHSAYLSILAAARQHGVPVNYVE